MSNIKAPQRTALRINQFEVNVRHGIERRYGPHGASEQTRLTLSLACHASLPVLLSADFVHLLRINFFNGHSDNGEELPPEAERDLLFSDLCTELGGGLYEIPADIRTTLLKRLLNEYGMDRLKEVSALLWSYTMGKTVWGENRRLENAQRLTALNFLEPKLAREWTRNARNRLGHMRGEQDWAVAMIAELEELGRYNRQVKKAALKTAGTRSGCGRRSPGPQGHGPYFEEKGLCGHGAGRCRPGSG